eukprot:gene6371-10378_t
MRTFVFLLSLIVLAYGAIIREEVIANLDLKSGKTDIILYMDKQVDFNTLSKNGVNVHEIANEDERGQYVMEVLQKQADESQRNIIRYLKQNNQKFEAFWVKNAIAVHGATEKVIKDLAQFKEVKFVNSNEEFAVELEQPLDIVVKNASTEEIEFNVKWINADKVWDMGHKGKKIVVGVIDTGVDPTHPALKANYRGTKKDGSVKHDYNWYDADRKVTTPVDSNGHGTHCTGTVCGAKDRKIGVAPKAKFIHCRAISGASQASKYLACYQFFMAPHDLEGKKPDPKLRPHSTSHSYGCGGCRVDDLKEAFEAMVASGIFLAVSAGNSGPRCSSVSRPPGNYASAFTVGALQKNSKEIARFSSKGPITYDGSNRLKPEICAPGVNVVSSFPRGGYRALSGTSMASPAVNGAVALLWDAVPELKRKIKETVAILTKTARKQTSTECGRSGSPNNVYGYGGIDILEAVKAAKKVYQQK